MSIRAKRVFETVLYADDLDPWRRHLNASGVPVESEIDWPSGGRSIYFRDPAGNSLELAPPTLWGGGFRF